MCQDLCVDFLSLFCFSVEDENESVINLINPRAISYALTRMCIMVGNLHIMAPIMNARIKIKTKLHCNNRLWYYVH
jgi:hypothetical protein